MSEPYLYRLYRLREALGLELGACAPGPRRHMLRLLAAKADSEVEAELVKQARIAARSARLSPPDAPCAFEQAPPKPPPPPQYCGSERGYHQHRYADEDPCTPCKRAHALRERERAALRRAARARPQAPEEPAPREGPSCGTDNGYSIHRRRKEAACDACRHAHAVRERERYRAAAQAAYAAGEEQAS